MATTATSHHSYITITVTWHHSYTTISQLHDFTATWRHKATWPSHSYMTSQLHDVTQLHDITAISHHSYMTISQLHDHHSHMTSQLHDHHSYMTISQLHDNTATWHHSYMTSQPNHITAIFRVSRRITCFLLCLFSFEIISIVCVKSIIVGLFLKKSLVFPFLACLDRFSLLQCFFIYLICFFRWTEYPT